MVEFDTTSIAVAASMGALVILISVVSAIYFYRLGAFRNCKNCKCCICFECKKKPKPLIPKLADSGKTMNLEDFEEHVAKLHANSDALFADEYNSLGPHFSERTAQTASTAINAEKNRYVAVVPYDQTRVRLQTISGVPGSNYINASYIDGYNRISAYAATQAPLNQTIPDFWRMVWETKSRIIVMVTNLVEKGRIKGEQYWPTTGDAEYEGFKVTLNSEKKYNHYIIRQFSVTKLTKSKNIPVETRAIWHYHYTAWPDHGVPDAGSTLTSFIIRTREHEMEYPSPTVVHCSAGVGRTGTFIVLDAQMRQYDQQKVINIYMYLMKIRSQRNYLVQQECQYIFIHDAILEYMKSGTSRIYTAELEMNIAMHYCTKGKTLTNQVNTEWDLLNTVQVSPMRVVAARKDVNLSKNRNRDVVSVDSFCVYLPTRIRVEGSNYINATFLDSFHAQNAYIITQAPMENTIEDLWRMVWENRVSIAINLVSTEEVDREENNIVDYVPKQVNTSVTFYEFEIKLTERKKYTNYYRRRLLISECTDTDTNKEFREVYHYHFMKWPDESFPSGNQFMPFLHDVFTLQADMPGLAEGTDGEIRPILIHDIYGSGRAAALSMIFHLKEQLLDNGSFIDVYAPMRIIKTRRTNIISDINQYNFVFKTMFPLIHYIKQYVLKTDSRDDTLKKDKDEKEEKT